jgi:hypothetical protein
VAAECASGTIAAAAVTAVDKTANRFVTGACSQIYDANDLFLIEGAPATLDQFEAALNVGDLVNSTYDADDADQSTFNINTDNAPAVTVTVPAAATSTTGFTTTISGTGGSEYTIRVYKDLNNNNTLDAGEPLVGTATAGVDGTWSVAGVPLTAGAGNNFIVTQREDPADADGPYVDVPTVTQGAVAGVTLAAVGNNVGVAGILSPSDTITITFSGAVTGVGSGDSITIADVDGSFAVLTCGTNVTCVMSVGDTVLTVTITNVLITTGNTDGIETQATIQSVTGFTSANGEAVNVAGSGAGRTFTGF